MVLGKFLPGYLSPFTGRTDQENHSAMSMLVVQALCRLCLLDQVAPVASRNLLGTSVEHQPSICCAKVAWSWEPPLKPSVHTIQI